MYCELQEVFNVENNFAIVGQKVKNLKSGYVGTVTKVEPISEDDANLSIDTEELGTLQMTGADFHANYWAVWVETPAPHNEFKMFELLPF